MAVFVLFESVFASFSQYLNLFQTSVALYDEILRQCHLRADTFEERTTWMNRRWFINASHQNAKEGKDRGVHLMVEGPEPAKKISEMSGRGKIVGLNAFKQGDDVQIGFYCLIESNPDQSDNKRYLYILSLENFVEVESKKENVMKLGLGDIGYDQLVFNMQLNNRSTLWPDSDRDIHSIPNWSASFFHPAIFFS
jgi:hypothetical protein